MKISNILKLSPISQLRSKIIIFVVILAVVPVLALGSLTLYLLGTSHRANVADLELQLAGQKIEEIEKFFADTLGILELRVGFSQKSEIEYSQQIFLLEGLLEENLAFEEVSFINLNGKETAKKARFESKLDLQDVSLLGKFKTASTGDNFMSKVYYTLSGPMITLAAPVFNRNDEIIQILSAEVNLTSLTQIIENARLGLTGYLVLVDSTGSLMAQGSGMVLRSGEAIQSGFSFKGFSRIAKTLQGQFSTGLEPNDRYESFFGQVAVVGITKPVSETGWVLLVEWPIEEADAIIRNIRRQVLLFTLFGVIAVLLLTPFFAERLVGPIRKLKKAAQDIEEGHFDRQVEIKTKDELEELGKAFNHMAKGLKRLEELRNEFVFIAAHELRAPVTVINGYLSMITQGEAGSVSPKIKEMLDPVAKSGQGLNKLVDDLLNVARSESGTIKFITRPVDIAQETKSITQQFKVLADQKSINVVYNIQPNLPKVMADPDKLKEVVKNLVDNAIKYTLGKGTVTVTHEIKDKMLITHIKDTGIGMSQKEQAKLFEKFYRVKAKEAQDISGTGLGLWIIKQLVQKMNGQIWVTSYKGQGSIFSFSLPVA